MNRRKAAAFLLIVTLVALAVFFPSSAEASFYFHIPKQQDQLTINENGSVTLVRYFDFFVEASSTDAGTEIWAGLPTSSTRVTSVVDDDGTKVDFNVRSSGGEYVVTLKGFSIKPGTGMGFTVTAETQLHFPRHPQRRLRYHAVFSGVVVVNCQNPGYRGDIAGSRREVRNQDGLTTLGRHRADRRRSVCGHLAVQRPQGE